MVRSSLVLYSLQQLPSHPTRLHVLQRTNTLKIFDSEYKRIVRKQRAVLAGYDCFLCVIELSSILRHNSKIKAELRAIMTNMSSDQTFGLLIDKDAKRKEESGLNFYLDFVQKLGFVNDSPLMSAPMNWGLWCLQGGIAELTNSRDILTGRHTVSSNGMAVIQHRIQQASFTFTANKFRYLLSMHLCLNTYMITKQKCVPVLTGYLGGILVQSA
ncbi:hypothetical protein EGR_09615 [Echinococcus granulosus]|uniref:Uncharacterized protein n=1 Tax=Echinococcus granulosus TaxID=6210 RepID=W6UQ71_ECHGR|nr:hypothetical protein EGR_09615 [Echinococcus granulosus]EUB55509.1 hypothetical protein EGR_09615 [Echinococcus granulosus]